MLTYSKHKNLGDATADAASLQTAINAAAASLGMGSGLIAITGTVDQNTALAAIAVAQAAVHSLGVDAVAASDVVLPGATTSYTTGSGVIATGGVLMAASQYAASDPNAVAKMIALLSAQPAMAAQAFQALANSAAASVYPAPTVNTSNVPVNAVQAAAAAINAGAAASSVPGGQPLNPYPVAPASSSKTWLWVGLGVLGAAVVGGGIFLATRSRRTVPA